MRPAEGGLDFSAGELLTVGDLVKRADAAFGRVTVFDNRAAPTYCYVQGRFTPESFLRFVKAESSPVAWDDAPRPSDLRLALQDLLRRRLPSVLDPANAPEGIAFSAPLGGDTLSASSLTGSFPALGGMLKANDVPADAEIRLFPALTFQLVGKGGYLDPGDPPGSSPLGNNWSGTYGMP